MATLRIAHQRRIPSHASRIERAADGIRWQIVLCVLLWPLLILFGRGLWFVFSGA